MQRMLIIGAVLAVAMMVFLSGLGTEIGGNKETKLYIGCWSASPVETDLINRQIALFEKAHPGVKVKLETVTGSYDTYIQTNIAAGTEPDVFYLEPQETYVYASRGLVLPLDKYIPKEIIDDFYPNLLAAFSYDGHVYGLPKDFNPLIMYYNKEMFKTAGIVQFPKTWTELLAACEKLKQAGATGALGDSFRKPMIVDSFVYPYIVQAGGQVYDEQANKLVFNSPESLAGFKFFYETLFRDKKYAAEAKTLGSSGGIGALVEKKTAIVCSGGWSMTGLQRMAPDWDYGTAVLPAGKQMGGIMFTTAYAIGKNSKHPELAAELIRTLTGPECEKMTAAVGLAVPPLKSLEHFYRTTYPRSAPLVEMTPYCITNTFGKKARLVMNEIDKVTGKFVAAPEADIALAVNQAYETIKKADAGDKEYNW
ncbi:MAG: sugar ABC transporter substrate-binding protein [Bacillota bacterium]